MSISHTDIGDNLRTIVILGRLDFPGTESVADELEKLAAKYRDVVSVVKVDVDANPALAQAFDILSIPTIALFQPGKQPRGVTGFRRLDQLESEFGLEQFVAGAT